MRFLLAGLAAASALLGLQSPAHAAFTVALNYNGTTRTITDRTGANPQAAVDQSLAIGDLTDTENTSRNIAVSAVASQTPFNGGFSNNLSSEFFLDSNLNVTTAANAMFLIRNLSAVGTETTFSRITGTNAGIDFLGTTNGTPAVLTILISDTFNVPNGPGNKLTVGLTVLLNKNGDLITSTSDATPFPSTVSTSSSDVVLPGMDPTGVAGNTTFNGTGGPFTLTNTTSVAFTDGNSIQFQSGTSVLPNDATATPAPSALVLAALGLPALGLLRRRFAKPTTVVGA